jgi:hypothetical protein
MARIVSVHGIGQQFEGSHKLHETWLPALRDGLDLAGTKLPNPDDLICAFYGDLFRPSGKAALVPPYDADDVQKVWELDMLQAWWEEASRCEAQVRGPDAQTKVRTPTIVQRALNALSQSKFFAGLAERALIFDLKQVYRYFHEPAIRKGIRVRVEEVIGNDTRVLVAHSLGSVAAYEVLCAHPEWNVDTLVTLGSPLGIRNLIFDKLDPCPTNERGAWPGSVNHWFNVSDVGDVVALVKSIKGPFGDHVEDRSIFNGASAHDVTRYLTAKETGDAVATGLE